MSNNFSISNKKDNNWKELIREKIVLMKETYQIKEIPDVVKGYITEKMEELKNNFKSKFENINEWQGLFTRLPVSIHKYLYAISCCHREEINKNHVDIAMKFIYPKFEYVSSLSSNVSSSLSDSDLRKKLIETAFETQESLTKDQISDVLKEECLNFSDKTISRD